MVLTYLKNKYTGNSMLLWRSLLFSKHYDLGRTNYYLGREECELGTESSKIHCFSQKKPFTQTNPPTCNKLPVRFSEAALLDSKSGLCHSLAELVFVWGSALYMSLGLLRNKFCVLRLLEAGILVSPWIFYSSSSIIDHTITSRKSS